MALTIAQRVQRARIRQRLRSTILHAWGQVCALEAHPCSEHARERNRPRVLAYLRAAGEAYAALPPLWQRSPSSSVDLVTDEAGQGSAG